MIRTLKTIRFIQTGKPRTTFEWTDRNRTTVKARATADFEPIIQICFVFRSNTDGSIDVQTLNPIFLSNGNGPTIPSRFFKLKRDNTIEYWNTLRAEESFKREPKVLYDLQQLILNDEVELKVWNRNIPTWSYTDNQISTSPVSLHNQINNNTTLATSSGSNVLSTYIFSRRKAK